jgi:histidinol-phosphate aminotransferase
MSDFVQLATPGIRGLRPYQPGKPIDELERELGISNIIKLASNENPLGPSPAALAAVNVAACDVWLYPDGGGFRLKQKLARLHGVDMSAITLGNGSSDLLEFVVRVFVAPGDEVLFSQHAFAIYPIVTRAVGGVPVEAPAANWGYDLDALAAAITAKTKVIFIANPNNPTGTYVRGAELEAFVRAVPERVIVVVDEAYFDYASHPAVGAVDYPDTSRWAGRYPNLMVTRTFSKSYGLAGLRVGYSISHPHLADLMNRVRPPFNVNSLALVGAEAALDDQEHLTRSVAMNADGLRQLMTGFETMGLGYIPSVGNFISVDVGREAAPLYDALLREGVIVRPVANYGMPNHLRVTVGRPEENARFLAALAKVLG